MRNVEMKTVTNSQGKGIDNCMNDTNKRIVDNSTMSTRLKESKCMQCNVI